MEIAGANRVIVRALRIMSERLREQGLAVGFSSDYGCPVAPTDPTVLMILDACHDLCIIKEKCNQDA